MDTTTRSFQVSLPTSLVIPGASFCVFTLTIPILYTRQLSVITPIFEELYTSGGASLVRLGFHSASCSAIVAYAVPVQRNLWTAASPAILGQLQWTLLVMISELKR